MKIFEVEVKSGFAYLMTNALLVLYAFKSNAPFSEFWIGLAALFTAHTGKRLWKAIKLQNGTNMTAPDSDPGKGMPNA